MRTARVHNGTYGLTETAMAALSSLESLTLTDCCAGRGCGWSFCYHLREIGIVG